MGTERQVNYIKIHDHRFIFSCCPFGFEWKTTTGSHDRKEAQEKATIEAKRYAERCGLEIGRVVEHEYLGFRIDNR